MILLALADPGSYSGSPGSYLVLLEPQGNLVLGAIGTITAVNDIPNYRVGVKLHWLSY